MLGCLLDHSDYKPARDDLRLSFCAGNAKSSEHMNIAFSLSTLKGLIAAYVERTRRTAYVGCARPWLLIMI
jgi:hypothetical protein